MGWVDIVLAVLVVVAAVHGLRLGAVIQVSSFVGFWVGFALGIAVALVVAAPLDAGATRTWLTLGLVLGLAALFGAAGRVIGTWAASALKRWRLGTLDASAGAAIGVLSVLLTAWLLAGFLVQSQASWLSMALDRSAVLRTVDKVLPPVPSAVSEVQGLLSDGGFPSVFASVLPPVATPASEPSDAAAAQIAGPALHSVVKVFGAACGGDQEGTAFVVAPGVVVTNAHVVAGMANPTLIIDGVAHGATPVLVDPSLDVAVLRTAAPLGPALRFDLAPVAAGTAAAIVGYPEDGPLLVTRAAVTASFDALGRDIYDETLVSRQVDELSAVVEPGNSGSPLMGPDGEVLGIVFSRSTVNSDVGYALAASAVARTVAAGEQRTTPVRTGSCAAGR